jgi:nicotinamidase-related amidase
MAHAPNFTPADSALVLIDHQLGTMKLVHTLPPNRVKRNTLALAQTAKVYRMPVVLTSSQETLEQGLLMPELAKLLPDEYAARVRRVGIVNAWDDRNFVAAVEKTGRANLIMAGVTTDVCLLYPAISAARAGYRVQAVLDAAGSPFDLSEDLARRRMENAGVVLTATNTLMAELVRDWSTAEGARVKAILFGEVLKGML